MHDGAIGLDRSLNDFIVILKVDDDDLRVGAFRNGLADADIVV